MKRNGLLIHETACMNPTGIILNERSQTPKATHDMITFFMSSWKGQKHNKEQIRNSQELIGGVG